MKVCITATASSLDAQVDSRFGRCSYFLIVDPETMQFEAISNEAISAMGGAGIQAAQAIASKGVEVLIIGNVGPNALQALQAAGIKIVTGISGTVREAIEKYRKGEIEALEAAAVEGRFEVAPGQRLTKKEVNTVGERVVIPVEDEEGLNARLSEHFGRTPFFVVVEFKDNGEISSVETVTNVGKHFGGGGTAFDRIAELKPNAVIVYGMGPRALSNFQNAGIAVLRANASTVKEVIEAYKENKLQELTEGCHHARHH
ncbi:MAG: NifB/NifX family molybdenum-iron cluster-binding protein [Candidatus Caldatribacteriaceae bacterium]